ncbi:MAG TPA: class E sortase [Nitriliruptorales bacterium]|nr:class E sortase [Nitriliruptorales bacterium]
MIRVLRTAGWLLIAAGAVILLYLVYLLFWTNRTTQGAQAQLLEEWNLQYGGLPGESAPAVTDRPRGPATPIEAGDAYAAIWFERPGNDEPPVTEAVLFVVEGTSLDILRRGPGHYVETAAPGEQGNFAISGHRTTYGAPFYHQDELQAGDEIHVVDRSGSEWVYVVRRSQVVAPTDLWVIGEDPLGNGEPVMTLTTCHPRFSAAQRLITWAVLAPESGREVAA